MTWSRTSEAGVDHSWGAGAGALVGVAAVCAPLAWFAIVFTGRYPSALYEFGTGALRSTTRVEAYLLLLTDDDPPFTLE